MLLLLLSLEVDPGWPGNRAARHHLQLHCYRILGSVHDAEDAGQETLLSAWQGLGGFEERASVRTWLYRVATNCCLKAQHSRRRSQGMGRPAPWPDLPEPTRLGQVLWLEPYPDLLLHQLTDTAPGPKRGSRPGKRSRWPS